MSTDKKVVIGKRAERNLELRKQMKTLLVRYLGVGDFSAITIRNLCKQAHITPSSFYNMYGALENFLCDYLVEDLFQYAAAHTAPKSVQGVERIIYDYQIAARYSESRGIEYARFFQTQYSKTNAMRAYYRLDSPIVVRIEMEHLATYHEAVCLKEIDSSYRSEVIFRYLDLTIASAVFTWCNIDGKMNLQKYIALLLNNFFSLELNDKTYSVIKRLTEF